MTKIKIVCCCVRHGSRAGAEFIYYDFMFQLTREEFDNLRFHFGTSSWGGQRYFPYAFTENGVAMLSSVLNSERAIKASIQNNENLYEAARDADIA